MSLKKDLHIAQEIRRLAPKNRNDEFQVHTFVPEIVTNVPKPPRTINMHTLRTIALKPIGIKFYKLTKVVPSLPVFGTWSWQMLLSLKLSMIPMI